MSVSDTSSRSSRGYLSTRWTGLIRYDSRVDECCLVGFLASRNSLKARSVLATDEKLKHEDFSVQSAVSDWIHTLVGFCLMVVLGLDQAALLVGAVSLLHQGAVEAIPHPRMTTAVKMATLHCRYCKTWLLT